MVWFLGTTICYSFMQACGLVKSSSGWLLLLSGK
ncbi:hypothetical protein ACNKHL_21520 [Shigella flexneri]